VTVADAPKQKATEASHPNVGPGDPRNGDNRRVESEKKEKTSAQYIISSESKK